MSGAECSLFECDRDAAEVSAAGLCSWHRDEHMRDTDISRGSSDWRDHRNLRYATTEIATLRASLTAAEAEAVAFAAEIIAQRKGRLAAEARADAAERAPTERRHIGGESDEREDVCLGCDRPVAEPHTWKECTAGLRAERDGAMDHACDLERAREQAERLAAGRLRGIEELVEKRRKLQSERDISRNERAMVEADAGVLRAALAPFAECARHLRAALAAADALVAALPRCDAYRDLANDDPRRQEVTIVVPGGSPVLRSRARCDSAAVVSTGRDGSGLLACAEHADELRARRPLVWAEALAAFTRALGGGL